MMRLHFWPRRYRRVFDEPPTPWVRVERNYLGPEPGPHQMLEPLAYFREIRSIGMGIWQETGVSWNCRNPNLVELFDNG